MCFWRKRTIRIVEDPSSPKYGIKSYTVYDSRGQVIAKGDFAQAERAAIRAAVRRDEVIVEFNDKDSHA